VRRGPASFLLVGGFHLVVFWALLHALQTPRPGPLSEPNTVVDVIDEQRPPPEHLPAPQVIPTAVQYQPPADIPKVSLPPMDEPKTITMPPPLEDIFVHAVVSEPAAVITGAAVDPRHPLTQPDYPMASIRSAEEGKIALAVLVGTDGRVLDAKVAQSSGSPRLDEAAVKEARAHWRLRPATRNGVPFEQWLTLGVVFRLANP
jgi:protein TonB